SSAALPPFLHAALPICRPGAISYWGAVLCALAALGLRLGIMGPPHFGGREPLSLDNHDYLWLALGHLMAALACAWLARQMFVPVRSSGDGCGKGLHRATLRPPS